MGEHSMIKRMTRSAQPGFSTIQLVIYLAVGAVVMSVIGALLYSMFVGQRAVSSETSQNTAVLNALQDMTRAIDESATIFKATETELGIGRNVTNETSGGLDCQIDQFYVDDTSDPAVLRNFTTTETGACRDVPDWTDVATIGATSVIVVHDLEPFTLVDDEGLTTAACTATESTADRGGDAGYCVPLFRYLDGSGAEFAPADPPAKNSISAVRIVLSGAHEGAVPVSHSKTVSPNNYTPNNTIGDVAAPMCPATITRTVAGNNVTVDWAPVIAATHYTVLRTVNGTTTTLATLSVAALADDANPTYTDSIAGIAAQSIVYQVVPRVGGEDAEGCPQTIVSVQVAAPAVTVQVIGGSGSASWLGNRANDTQAAVGTMPSLRASWTAVAGATSYEAQMREVNANPAAANPVLTGWAAFNWNGAAFTSSSVPGGTTQIQTNTWAGNVLFSRAFQVRVRAISESGSSPWTYCYMESGDGAAGTCGQFAGDSFPANGDANVNLFSGYLVMPGPATTTVTDVLRSYSSDNVNVSWGNAAGWTGGTETNDFYRVQQRLENGTTGTLNYSSAFANLFSGKTTTTSGTTSVNAGDWNHLRTLRCNYINPYATSGAGLEQCGPASRVWSALGLPGVPGLRISVDSVANTNAVFWGKDSSVSGWTADFDDQRVSYYDVAQTQAGGTGTTAASGSTSLATVTSRDSVIAGSKSAPWQNNTTLTTASHGAREGDFTRYSPRACATNALVNANVAGVTGEAGQGVGTESCSDWRGDSYRYWQNVAPPRCTVSDDWNTITITGQYNHSYLSPLDTVLERRVLSYNDTEGVGWSSTSTTNSMANYSYVRNDDGSSADDRVGTVKPGTSYHGSVGLTTQYATAGVEHYVADCASGTVDNPPVPERPSASATVSSVNAASDGTPNIRRAWDADDSPTTSGYVQVSFGSGYSSTANSGSSTVRGLYDSTYSISVRSAHTARLASWGWWSPVGSDSITPNIANYGGCPAIRVINDDGYGASKAKIFAFGSPTHVGGGVCEVNVATGPGWQLMLRDTYRVQVDNQCAADPTALDPAYTCASSFDRQTVASARATSSPYTQAGTLIGALQFRPGSSMMNDPGNGYAYWDWQAWSMPSGVISAADMTSIWTNISGSTARAWNEANLTGCGWVSCSAS